MSPGETLLVYTFHVNMPGTELLLLLSVFLLSLVSCAGYCSQHCLVHPAAQEGRESGSGADGEGTAERW